MAKQIFFRIGSSGRGIGNREGGGRCTWWMYFEFMYENKTM
jgi:hypothetical protein